MQRIRILVVDDHPLLRDAVRILAGMEPDLEVVGEAADGAQAVRLVEELRPDVLVLDARLPSANAADVARAVRRDAPRTRIVVFTGYASDDLAVALLNLGVQGYLLKSAGFPELALAVRRVYAGERYVDPFLAGKLLLGPKPPAGVRPTAREAQVLELVMAGKGYGEIARQLGISYHTVHYHVRNLLEKSGTTNRLAMVTWARQHGWIPS